MRLFLAFLVSFSQVVYGQVPSPKQYINGTIPVGVQAEVNYVRNPSAFASATFAVTKSGSSTMVRSTTSGYKYDGVASFGFDTANNSEYAEWSTNTISDQHTAGNCEVHAYIKGDGSLYSLQVTDGTTVLQSLALTNATNWTYAGFNYPCGSTRKVRVAQTTAGTSPLLNIANVYWGPATNLVNVSQASFIGSAYFETTSGCLWSRGSTTLGGFGTVSNCPGPTVENNPSPYPIQTTDTDTPKFTVNNLPPGNYHIVITGTGDVLGSPNTGAFRINDGTSTFGSGAFYCDASTINCAFTVDADFSYTTSGNRSFELFASAGASAVVNLRNADGAKRTHFSIHRYPSESELAVRPDQTNYGWTLYTPTFTGFGTVASSTCYHKRAGGDLFLRCLFPAGTPTAVEARVSLPSGLVTPSTVGSLETAGSYVITTSGTNHGGAVFIEPSLGYITFGDAKTYSNGTVAGLAKATGNNVVAASDSISLQARVPINGWTENQNAPILVGSVTSNSAGAERIERAYITGASTITSQSGSWLTSVTNNATGDRTLNIAAGIFSAAPNCGVTIVENAVGIPSAWYSTLIKSVSTSAFRFATWYGTGSTGTGNNYDAQVICMGPR